MLCLNNKFCFINLYKLNNVMILYNKIISDRLCVPVKFVGASPSTQIMPRMLQKLPLTFNHILHIIIRGF